MHEHGPEGYPIVTYIWVLILSVWGGAVNFWQKMKVNKVRAFNLVEFIGDLSTAALTGLVTFYLAESAHLDKVFGAALIAISGHMGARLIFMLERIIEKKLSKY
jgi:hypothetical protein